MLFVDGGNDYVLIGSSSGDIGGSADGVRINPNGNVMSGTSETGGITTNFYGDRRGTNNVGIVYSLALGGYYKSSIGVLGQNNGSNNGGIVFSTIQNNSAVNERMRISPTSVTINEEGDDQDFRVESNGNANMLFVDGGANVVSVGNTAGYGGKLNVNGSKTVGSGIPVQGVTVVDHTAVAEGVGGAISFSGIYDTNNNITSGGSVEAYKRNATSGHYSWGLQFRSRTNGSTNDKRLYMDEVNTVFNEDSYDTDFRVESNNKAYMIYIDAAEDAVGINNSDPRAYPANSFTGTGTTGGQFAIGGSVGSFCVAPTGNELAFTRDSLNYIGAFGTSASFNIRAGTSGGVSLANTGTSWGSLSDERLKTITGNIENASDKVKTLRTVMGRYTIESEDVSHPFLIAQDVQKVLPEAVYIQPKDPDVKENSGVENELQLSYTDVIPLLTAALKEAITKIEALETKVTALENA